MVSHNKEYYQEYYQERCTSNRRSCYGTRANTTMSPPPINQIPNIQKPLSSAPVGYDHKGRGGNLDFIPVPHKTGQAKPVVEERGFLHWLIRLAPCLDFDLDLDSEERHGDLALSRVPSTETSLCYYSRANTTFSTTTFSTTTFSTTTFFTSKSTPANGINSGLFPFEPHV